MAAEGRGKRVLLGCLGGCAILLLLLVGSCVGFTVWVNSPGDVLNPEVIFDPTAAGFVEWELSLEDPGTEAIVQAFTRMLDREDDLPQSELLRGLFRYNQRRNEKELRKLFPAAAAWVPYPADESGAPGDLYTVSVARMVNQSRIADWVLSGVARFADDMPVVRYNGELILSVEENDSHFHGFLHPMGAFFASRLDIAQRAVDALKAPSASGESSLLLQEFSSLGDAGSIRGVLLNDDGLLKQRLEFFFDDGLDDDIALALEQVDLLTLRGGPVEGGDLEMTLDLRADPSSLALIEVAVERVLADFRSAELPFRAESRSTGRGIEVALVLEDVPKLLDEFGDEMGEMIEEGIEEAVRERELEIEDATRGVERDGL